MALVRNSARLARYLGRFVLLMALAVGLLPITMARADGDVCGSLVTRYLGLKEELTQSERLQFARCVSIMKEYSRQLEQTVSEPTQDLLDPLSMFGRIDGTFAADECYLSLGQTPGTDPMGIEAALLACQTAAAYWVTASNRAEETTTGPLPVVEAPTNEGPGAASPASPSTGQASLGAHWSDFCEKNKLGEFCGELTMKSDGTWEARWKNGAVASFDVSQTGTSVSLTRKPDTAGPSQGLRAEYQGEIKGNQISGTVSWSGTGSPVVGETGTWRATIDR
jgi:hypothetical protein